MGTRCQSKLSTTQELYINMIHIQSMMEDGSEGEDVHNISRQATATQGIELYYVLSQELTRLKTTTHSSPQQSQTILVPYYKIIQFELIPDSLIETYLLLLTQPDIKTFTAELVRAKRSGNIQLYLKVRALIETCRLNPYSLIKHKSSPETLKGNPFGVIQSIRSRLDALGTIDGWQERDYESHSDAFPTRKVNLQGLSRLLFHQSDVKIIRLDSLDIRTRQQLHKDNLFMEMKIQCIFLSNMLLLRRPAQSEPQPSVLTPVQQIHLANLMTSRYCLEDQVAITPSHCCLLTMTNAEEFINKHSMERNTIKRNRQDTLNNFYQNIWQQRIEDIELWISLGSRIKTELCLKFSSTSAMLQVLRSQDNSPKHFHLEPITTKDYEEMLDCMDEQLPLEELQTLLSIIMNAEYSLDVNHPNFRWNITLGNEDIKLGADPMPLHSQKSDLSYRTTSNRNPGKVSNSSRMVPVQQLFWKNRLFQEIEEYQKPQKEYKQKNSSHKQEYQKQDQYQRIGRQYHKYRGVLGEMVNIWSPSFKAFVDSLAANYKECRDEDQENIKKLIYYSNYMELMYPKVYDGICPGIKQFTNELCRKIVMPLLQDIIKRDTNKDQKDHEHEIKKLLEFYVSEGCSINAPTEKLLSLFYNVIYEKAFHNKQLSVKVKDKGTKRPIKQYFDEYLDFCIYTSGIQDILAKIRFFCFERNILESQNSQKDLNPLSKATSFVASLENQRIPDKGYPGCPGCTSFYFQDLNIRDDSINSTPILALSLKLTEQHAKQILREYVCMLLNSHGGVILFNTEAEYLSIYVQGTTITEEQKIVQADKIEQILQEIQPRPQMHSQVIIEFVPIAKSYRTSTQSKQRQPQDQHFSPKIKKSDRSADSLDTSKNRERVNDVADSAALERSFIEGRYVCRIKVKPTDPSVIYLASKQHSQFMLINNYQKRYIPLEEKKSYLEVRQNRLTSSLSRSHNGKLLSWSSTFTSHVCSVPEKGLPQFKSGKETIARDLGLELSYRDMSLVVCRRRHIDLLRKKFLCLGIQCEIVQLFQKHKFSLCESTAVVYHDCLFQQLVSLASKPEFSIQDKPLLVINVSDYLRLVNRHQRPGDEEMRRISEWISMEFPGSIVRLWQYRYPESDCSYYLSGENKTANLFLYFLLNHFGQKAFFKNPAKLDHIDLKKRSAVWKEISFQGQIYPAALRRQLINQIVALRHDPLQSDLFNQLCNALRSYVQTKNMLLEQPWKVQKYFQLLQNKQIEQLRGDLAAERRISKEKAYEIAKRILKPAFVAEYLSLQ